MNYFYLLSALLIGLLFANNLSTTDEALVYLTVIG